MTYNAKMPHGIFDDMGTLTEELDKYFKLYNIYLPKDRLDDYVVQLETWHKRGKSVLIWLNDIISFIKEFKCASSPPRLQLTKAEYRKQYFAKMNK